jgi:hypothetical protein
MFRREYEHVLETWLRRRFTWLCVTFVVVGGIKLLWRALVLLNLAGAEATPSLVGATSLTAVEGVVSLGIVAFFYLERKRFESRDDVIRAATWMILALGLVSLATRFLVGWLGYVMPVTIIAAIFFWHLTTCLFLPWTPRDSLRPIVPLLAIWAAHTLFVATDKALATRLLSVLFSPGILIPGLLVCGLRLRQHTRQFRSVMLGKHFRTLRQEFSRARTIHESLFPAEYDDGYVRFQYTYAPMRELGGDFLHINVGPEGLVHLTLLDVTGHGLAAALTVNRLYGELERIRAEAPRARPGEVLGLLNRYIHLTMVRHNIYATAFVVTLDPYAGEITWASAGHPPAFLCGANGGVRPLPATTVLLGALGDDDFDTDERSCELAPGDVIVAYTDGAFEARDRHGHQYGLGRFEELLRRAPPPANWPQFISTMVDEHQVGHAEDDVLVTALTFVAVRPQRQTAKPALARS